MGRAWRSSCLVTLVAMTSGCSWLFVTPPVLVADPPDCTESVLAPVVDTVVAVPPTVLAGVFVIGAFGRDCEGECLLVPDTPLQSLAIAGVFAVLALPAWLSATYGYRHTRRCREQVKAIHPGTAGHACRPMPADACDEGLTCQGGECRPSSSGHF